MIYAVYYKRISDGRAPEYVDLGSDYTYYGKVEASNRRDLERIVATRQDPDSRVAGTTRRILIGDVVIESADGAADKAFIYTPTGAWAEVKVVG